MPRAETVVTSEDAGVARADRSPPPEVAALVPELDPLRLSVPTDLAMNGERVASWLLATDDRLAVIRGGDTPRVLLSLPLAGVTKFRVEGAVGSGFLQASIDGTWIDLLRFSKRLSGRFARVARALERRLTEPGPLEIHEPRCPTCDLPLAFDGDICPRCVDRRAVVMRVWELLRGRRGRVAVLLAFLAVTVAVQMVPPKLQQFLVDDVLLVQDASRTNQALGLLAIIVATLALSRLIAQGATATKGVLGHRLGVDLVLELRRRVIERLHTLPIAFFDKSQTGVLVARILGDTESVHGLMMQIANGFLMHVLQFVVVGFMLFTLDVKLALYTLIPAPLVVAGSAYYWRRIHPRHYEWSDANSKHAGTLSGMMAGIRVVKAFAQEPRELDRFETSGTAAQRARLEVTFGGTTYGATMGLVFSMGGLLVWYVGGLDVLGREMTLGALMAFLSYLGLFYAPLSSLTQLTTWLSGFTSATHRVFELLDTPPEAADAAHPVRLRREDRELSFENVTFGYERHAPVLEDVSFTIPAGQMVGIVGKSGSGKTTLANLLCRFYDPDDGHIRIGGHDIREIARKDLRRHVGVVLQETFLFRGTVFDNLVYGDAEATHEQALVAAHAAQAHRFIRKLPFGYDSPIAERGTNVSGGERQRIAIARALLYDPPILILDEATSSLDTETERAVQDALFAFTRGRTTLAIAHRLSTLRHADRILVFEHHALVEDGTHEELLEQNGIYARLVRMQSRLAGSGSVDAVDSAAKSAEESPPESTVGPAWLTPDRAAFERGEHDTLVLVLDGVRHEAVRAARLFPATLPDRYVSIASGTDGEELGIVGRLADWDDRTRAFLEDALLRRYHLTVIERIDAIVLDAGLLHFTVRTKNGPETMWMRWAQTEAADYGPSGKLLTDVDGNYWLVPDVTVLPAADRARLKRFVYWS